MKAAAKSTGSQAAHLGEMWFGFLLAAVLLALFAAQPDRAGAAVGGVRAAVLMPFPDGGTTGIESPSSHWNFFGSGFAWDLHKGPGAAVYARIASSDGVVSLYVPRIGTNSNQSGQWVEVQVRVGASTVGTLYFNHLKNVQVSANRAYPADQLLGYLGDGVFATTRAHCADRTADGWRWSSSWQVCTSPGIHTHVDVKQGCYRSLGTGAAVSPGTGIILLSTSQSATNKAACDTVELDAVASGQVDSHAQLLVIRQGSSILQGKVGLNDSWAVLGGLDGEIVASGNRLAVLTPSGDLWAKDGLNGTWFLEAQAVTDFAVSQGLLVIRQGSSILQGKVGLNDSWAVLGGLDGEIVASGNRLAVLTPSGDLWAKDGLNGTWFLEAQAVTDFAVSG